jgi:hypothetical protein
MLRRSKAHHSRGRECLDSVATRGEQIMPDTNVTTHAEIASVSVPRQPATAEPAKADKPAGCGPGFERLSGLMAS